jgi:hypothetical protein
MTTARVSRLTSFIAFLGVHFIYALTCLFGKRFAKAELSWLPVFKLHYKISPKAILSLFPRVILADGAATSLSSCQTWGIAPVFSARLSTASRLLPFE